MTIKRKDKKIRKQIIKEKQEETIMKMKKRRQIDSDNLRIIIQQKLKWAEIEREKGLKIIEINKKEILKLEGIILFIKDLLEPNEE